MNRQGEQLRTNGTKKNALRGQARMAAAVLAAMLLAGTAAAGEPVSEAVSEGASPDTAWEENRAGQVEAARAIDTSQTAAEDEMTAVDEVGTDVSSAVTADMLKDGTYLVDAESSSSMFNIMQAAVTVCEGHMTVDLTLHGKSFLFLYPGTVQEAAAADARDFIYYDVDDEGYYVYRDFPLEALNSDVACAAFSGNKYQWYPRTLYFKASSLDSDDYLENPAATVASLGLSDGTYEIDAVLDGLGSRTVVTSPARLSVTDGQAWVRLELNSDDYDYLKIEETVCEQLEGEENSVFEVPVEEFDVEIPVIGDNIALAGRSVERDLTLYLNSASITAAE